MPRTLHASAVRDASAAGSTASAHTALAADQRQKTIDDQLEKARVDETRKADALRAAQLKTAGIIKRRQACTHRVAVARREFERAMRASAPADLFDSFAARIDTLLAEAIPLGTVITFYTAMHERKDVMVWGDAAVSPGYQRHAIQESLVHARRRRASETVNYLRRLPNVDEEHRQIKLASPRSVGEVCDVGNDGSLANLVLAREVRVGFALKGFPKTHASPPQRTANTTRPKFPVRFR